MKAIVLHEYGGPENLKYESVPDPVAGPGEVLIRVAASSVNPIDYKLRSGEARSYYPLELPAIIGVDFFGIVREVGEKVRDYPHVLVLGGEPLHEIPEHMFLCVSGPVEEPDFAIRTILGQGVGHRDHRRHSHAARDQDHGALLLQVEVEVPVWRLYIQDVPLLHAVAEVRGADARRVDSPFQRRAPLHRHAVMRRPRAVRERVAAHYRLVEAGEIELEREVLPGLERRQGLSVMGLKPEGEGVRALHGLLRDGKLADSAPGRLGLLGPLYLQPGLLDLKLQAPALQSRPPFFGDKTADADSNKEAYLEG